MMMLSPKIEELEWFRAKTCEFLNGNQCRGVIRNPSFKEFN
jgi:hypothetical protein